MLRARPYAVALTSQQAPLTRNRAVRQVFFQLCFHSFADLRLYIVRGVFHPRGQRTDGEGETLSQPPTDRLRPLRPSRSHGRSAGCGCSTSRTAPDRCGDDSSGLAQAKGPGVPGGAGGILGRKGAAAMKGAKAQRFSLIPRQQTMEASAPGFHLAPDPRIGVDRFVEEHRAEPGIKRVRRFAERQFRGVRT